MLAAAKPDTVTPLAHMLAILNDPGSPPSRKDAAAAAAAPYMHPKLNLSATSELNGGGAIASVTVIGIPRGGQYCPESGLIRYADGFEIDPPPFAPALPSPDISELPPPVEPTPLPVIEPAADDGKVERLDAWRRRSEGDGPTGAA